MARIVFLFLVVMFTAAKAFVLPVAQIHQRQRSPIVWQSAFDDIRETVQDQLENGAPVIEQAKQAGYLPGLHWGHGTVMAIIFLTMGLSGEQLHTENRIPAFTVFLILAINSYCTLLEIRGLVGVADSLW